MYGGREAYDFFSRRVDTNDAWSSEMTQEVRFVLYGAATLALTIFGLSLWYFFNEIGADTARLVIAKSVFETVVVSALLPMFNAVVTAVLAWVFGKPLVAAIATRLNSSSRSPRNLEA
jgi:hypothetical protein